MATVTDLLNRIETRLSLLGGLDVQTYGQPKIVNIIQDAFDVVYRKTFWKRHRLTSTWALSASTGMVTIDLSALIVDNNDIDNIWVPSYQSPLAEAPSDINPSMIYAPCFAFNGDPTKLFTVYPIGGQSQVIVRYRTAPADFKLSDDVPFDANFIMHEACAQYLIMEGANTTAAKDERDKAEKRLTYLLQQEQSFEKSLYGAGAVTQDQWRDA